MVNEYQTLPETPTNTEDSSKVRTGDWKTFYPTLIEEKCIKCYICWKFCPDVSVKVKDEESYPTFDLDHCKGCGICAHECPKDAIEMKMEE